MNWLDVGEGLVKLLTQKSSPNKAVISMQVTD